LIRVERLFLDISGMLGNCGGHSNGFSILQNSSLYGLDFVGLFRPYENNGGPL